MFNSFCICCLKEKWAEHLMVNDSIMFFCYPLCVVVEVSFDCRGHRGRELAVPIVLGSWACNLGSWLVQCLHQG